MPKLIKDLDNKIINSCMNLFTIHSYDKVEMKMIAKECGIAVGTLYNYYDSKWDVFSKVLKLFWDNVFLRLEDLRKLPLDPQEKFSNALEILRHELENKTSLSSVFYDSRGLSEEDIIKVKEIYNLVVDQIISFIKPLSKIKNNEMWDTVEKRFSEHILLTLTHMGYELEETSLLTEGILSAMEQVLKVSKVELNQ